MRSFVIQIFPLFSLTASIFPIYPRSYSLAFLFLLIYPRLPNSFIWCHPLSSLLSFRLSLFLYMSSQEKQKYNDAFVAEMTIYISLWWCVYKRNDILCIIIMTHLREKWLFKYSFNDAFAKKILFIYVIMALLWEN